MCWLLLSLSQANGSRRFRFAHIAEQMNKFYLWVLLWYTRSNCIRLDKIFLMRQTNKCTWRKWEQKRYSNEESSTWEYLSVNIDVVVVIPIILFLSCNFHHSILSKTNIAQFSMQIDYLNSISIWYSMELKREDKSLFFVTKKKRKKRANEIHIQ